MHLSPGKGAVVVEMTVCLSFSKRGCAGGATCKRDTRHRGAFQTRYAAAPKVREKSGLALPYEEGLDVKGCLGTSIRRTVPALWKLCLMTAFSHENYVTVVQENYSPWEGRAGGTRVSYLILKDMST